MRYDETKSDEFVNSKFWEEAESRFLLYELKELEPNKMGYEINSFSGNERNRLFFQSDNNFVEASTVSGVDFREDGRAFALLDYDQDGWLDMAIMSAQSPRFRLMKNSIKSDNESESHAAFIKLVGGNTGTGEQTEWSSRDPVGAEVTVTIGENKRMFRLSCGEGLSSQNTGWIHVGMGSAKTIDRIDIKWPSGKETFAKQIPAGKRTTYFENPDEPKRD